MVKVLISTPLYEKHSAHLNRIVEQVSGLELPEGWKREIFFAVNNSTHDFVKKVAHICAEKGFSCKDLGEVHEERLMTLAYQDGKEKDYMAVCRDNKGYILAKIRNEILDQAIMVKADWLIMVDADSIFPQDTLLQLMELLRLLSAGIPLKDIGVLSPLPVKLNTRINMPDGIKYFTPSIYYRPENNPDGETRKWLYENLKRLQYFTVDGVGFGFALIPFHIFNKFRFDPSKSSISAAQDGTYMSEDYAYCLQLRDAGFKIVVHPRVECDYSETEK